MIQKWNEAVGGARGNALAASGLLFTALVWGLSWWPFKHLQALGLHPLWATSLIFGFALLCLLAWKPQAWRGFGAPLWLLALASGLANVGFNWAVTAGDVVRVVLLFYLMPAWSVFLAWWLLGERPGLGAMARLLLALAGVALVLKTPTSAWPWPASAADWMALAAGFGFALTNALLRRLAGTPPAALALAMFGGGCALAVLVALWGLGQAWIAAPPALAAGWLLLVGLLALAFLAGNLALQYGAAHLPAQATALILLSEVVFASVSAVLLGAAEWSQQTLLGGSLVLLAAFWAAWPQRHSATATDRATD